MIPGVNGDGSLLFQDIFYESGGHTVNEDVTTYIQQVKPWQSAVCYSLRIVVHETVPDVEERMQYGKPHFLKDGSYVAVIHVSKDKVSFMLFNATDVSAPGLLRSMGKGERKTADITEGQTVDYQHLATVLGQTVHAGKAV
jgi:hypothetical protein